MLVAGEPDRTAIELGSTDHVCTGHVFLMVALWRFLGSRNFHWLGRVCFVYPRLGAFFLSYFSLLGSGRCVQLLAIHS